MNENENTMDACVISNDTIRYEKRREMYQALANDCAMRAIILIAEGYPYSAAEFTRECIQLSRIILDCYYYD
jgi:hypothetical protein